MSPETKINVVSERGLRQHIERGQAIEILCKAAPERKGPTWHGTWVMRTVGIDGEERMLVTARSNATGDIKIREFKTATGVISFLIGIGFASAHFPLKTGHRTTHRLTEKSAAAES